VSENRLLPVRLIEWSVWRFVFNVEARMKLDEACRRVDYRINWVVPLFQSFGLSQREAFSYVFKDDIPWLKEEMWRIQQERGKYRLPKHLKWMGEQP
jgi:hypothetical protein